MKETAFSQIGLSSELVSCINSMGYEKPTPIQAQAIPHALEGTDVLGLAQTGTGKTAAFGLPLVDRLSASSGKTQALVICPTRELAVQVAKQLTQFSAHTRYGIVTLIGGQSLDQQSSQLARKADIVVGTPGRIMDHIKRKTLSLSDVSVAVLDEADEMLNMGFRDDIEAILKKTPAERQTLLFSATMPKQISHLAQKFQRSPVIVKIEPDHKEVNKIQQVYFEVGYHDKMASMIRLFTIEKPDRAIIFCNTIRKVDEVARNLVTAGYGADALHGDMRQTRRDSVMARFRGGKSTILVATDVAARGIDVTGVDVVVNFDLPLDCENYVHRIGRTGRAGATGKAYSIILKRDLRTLRSIQNFTKMPIECGQVPTYEVMVQHQLESLWTKASTALAAKSLGTYRSFIEKRITNDQGDVRDIAAALLKCAIDDSQKGMESSALSHDDERPRFPSNPRRRQSRGGDFGGRGREGRERSGFGGGFRRRSSAGGSGFGGGSRRRFSSGENGKSGGTGLTSRRRSPYGSLDGNIQGAGSGSRRRQSFSDSRA